LKIQNAEDLNLFEYRFSHRILLTLASSGDLSTLAHFSRLGLNLNLKCPLSGCTALHLAVKNNNTGVLKYLLTMDCELAKDHEGQTAFDLIQSQEVLEIICQKFKERPVSSIGIAKAVLKKDDRRIAIYRKINAMVDVSELKASYGLEEA
jgi:hypothetical protein